MKFFSTNNSALRISLKEAVLEGLAADCGLYMPERIPAISQGVICGLSSLSLADISLEVTKLFVENDLSGTAIKEFIDDAIDFPAPLVKLDDNTFILELFHGPTLAFKDFGARFMSRLISQFRKPGDRDLTILVATSGDTGSAVAYGFYNVPGIRVVLLYPSGQVSALQEKQLTTLGGNVSALEISGTFDDCQRMVKQAFADSALRQEQQLTSANSINIARLIPQSFYYFHAVGQLPPLGITPIFSVPSGNFGNLTAGLIAQRMGLAVSRFVAATNANDIFPTYLDSGHFSPRPSVATISNAMDVGNPNNFPRILSLFNNQYEEIRSSISGERVSDDETRAAIKEVYKQHNYVLDPHTAVAYLGLKRTQEKFRKIPGIVLSTAHPAKFLDVVEPLLGTKIAIPERLAAVMDKPKQTTKLPADYSALRSFLTEN